MSETIRVNFGRPIGLFPFPDMVLLPHETLPLHIFERRYRQLVHDCLDRDGQFAIATWQYTASERRQRAAQGLPMEEMDHPVPLRPIVCVGQIIQHDAMADGRYNVWLHGVCRASIRRMHEVTGNRYYRQAQLEPVEVLDEPPPPMPRVRRKLRRLLRAPGLDGLNALDKLREWIDHEGIPTRALIELIAFATVNDTEQKYRLLAEANPVRRARMLEGELEHLRALLRSSGQQSQTSWPKGMSWN